MTDLTTSFRPKPEAVAAPAGVEPTLITEQQVLFGSAAAVGAPRRPRSWTALLGLAQAARWFVAPSQQKVRHHRPSKHTYLEHALLTREMDRL